MYKVLHTPDLQDMDKQHKNSNKRRRWKLAHHDRHMPDEDGLSQKRELHQVLNAFQHSNEWGVYVCEGFKDPRRHDLDDYWSEVQEEANGIQDMRSKLGKLTEPLDNQASAAFNHFSKSLQRLAKRIDHILQDTGNSPEDDDVQIVDVESYPCIEATIDIES